MREVPAKLLVTFSEGLIGASLRSQRLAPGVLSYFQACPVRRCAFLLHVWLYLRLFLRVFFIFKGHAPLEALWQLQVLEVIDAYRDEGAVLLSCVCLVGYLSLWLAFNDQHCHHLGLIFVFIYQSAEFSLRRLAGLPPTLWAVAVPMNYERPVKDLLEDIAGDHEYMMQQRQQQV